MSQPDLVTQLRAARPAAPPELRERVRAIVTETAPPGRRFRWRRVAALAVPVAAAIAAAAVLLPGGSDHRAAKTTTPLAARAAAPVAGAQGAELAAKVTRATSIVTSLGGRTIPGVSATELRFRVPAGRVSEAVRQLSKLGSVTHSGTTVVLRVSPS